MRDLLIYLIFGSILFTSFAIWSDILITLFHDFFDNDKKY